MPYRSFGSFVLSPRLFWVVIALYVLTRLALNVLNYRNDASPEARQRALHYFSEEVIDEGARYHHAGAVVAFLFFLAGIAALVALLVSGASSELASVCLRWAGGRPWLQVILYLAVLLLAAGAGSLPFLYYLDYVLEHRFGFSNQTPSQWLLFQFKSALVSGALIMIAATAAYALLRRFPTAWVWMIPAGALALQLSLTVLYPRLIMPIFYKIEPIKDAALVASISGVAEKAGVKIRSLYLIDESRYSSHTNAFFIGFGSFRSIYIYDTLVKNHSPEEVRAVLAHELGHWKGNHVAKGIALGELAIIAACVLLYFVFPLLHGASFVHIGPMREISSLPMLLLLFSLASFFGSPVESMLSRHFERDADAFSLELTESPEAFIQNFKTMAIENRANLLPHPIAVFWRYSHPPILERIETADRLRGKDPAQSPSRD